MAGFSVRPIPRLFLIHGGTGLSILVETRSVFVWGGSGGEMAWVRKTSEREMSANPEWDGIVLWWGNREWCGDGCRVGRG